MNEIFGIFIPKPKQQHLEKVLKCDFNYGSPRDHLCFTLTEKLV